jgi:parallel beta-helix repeat protein
MKKIYLLLLLCLCSYTMFAQIQMPLPVHASNYNGTYARGYWFVAPISFTITGLMVAPEAGTGTQYIHLMKTNFPMTGSGGASSNFTTLAYISNAPNNTIQSVNIPVTAGDTIAVLGTVTGIQNSYTASGVWTTTIGSSTVNLNRGGYQGSIETAQAPTFWGMPDGTAGELGRVFIYYSVGPCTDPPVAGTTTASTTTACTGMPVNLNLTAGTFGTGQTYEWQSSSSASGPFTTFSGTSASSAYTAYPYQNTYYRAAVTCGLNTDYSVPILVNYTAGISGSYTIDATQPAGNGNFTSFASALSTLSCGVSGPVTFNVAPGSGPYNEQINISSVNGASAANTITINGNGNTVQFTGISSARHLVKLDGADYITINNLNLVSQSPTYGWGVHLINGADYNTISNCTINLTSVTSTTTSNSAGIVASNSSTSGISAGNNGNYNNFIGNTIYGGYRGVSFMGNVTGLNAAGNSFIGNTIQDFYADGFYMEDNDGTAIINNDIQRPLRAAAATGAGIEANAGNRNLLIKGNRIHDTHTTALTGTFYGIYFTGCDAPTGMENKVINNLLYKFNSTSSTIYALYNSSSDGAWYYHNTVVLDHAAATGGVTRGVYQTSAASNIQIKNNVFYITRGGSGAKYCLYFNTSTSSIISNNNDLYIAPPAGTFGVGYYAGGQTTLANWQAVNGSAYDQQSASLNPLFQSAATGDFTPTNTSLDNLGALVGVSTDINNNARSSTTPDMGSYEFLNVPSPLSVKLAAFDAKPQGTDVEVSWIVYQERNMKTYVIERSDDGAIFSIAGEVKASGSSPYSFTDKDVLSHISSGRLHYRLKFIEHDGSFQYSAVKTINLPGSVSVASVSPVPFADRIWISMYSAEEGSCSLQIKDLFGKTCAAASAFVMKGNNTLEMADLGKLPSGVYTLITDMNGIQTVSKIVK